MAPKRTSLRASPKAVPSRGRSAWRALETLRGGACVVLVAIMLLAGSQAHADKTDIAVLVNADRITGEVKGMSQGQLDFKTDDVGRIFIEWIKVARLTSTHIFEVELTSGQKYYGTLQSPADGKVWVGSEEADVFAVPDIIAITPMDDQFLARLKAYLDIGFTLAKSNDALTISGDGQVAYRGQHFGGSFGFNMYLQNDKNSTAVAQYSIDTVGQYFLTKWRLQLQLEFDHNDELELTLRVAIGGGVAYPVVRNTWNELWLSGGLLGGQEQYTTGEPNQNLASYVGCDWEAFIYDHPKLTAGASIQILPILTELWRTRGNVVLKVKYELFYNFFIGANFSYTFDTQPPDPTAAHTDYLLSLTIGWSYRR
jgi:hypothetical protein